MIDLLWYRQELTECGLLGLKCSRKTLPNDVYWMRIAGVKRLIVGQQQLDSVPTFAVSTIQSNRSTTLLTTGMSMLSSLPIKITASLSYATSLFFFAGVICELRCKKL